MARKVSFSALESRSARLKLKVRRRPYSGPSLARGIALMYRRNKTNGTWVMKASDGQRCILDQGLRPGRRLRGRRRQERADIPSGAGRREEAGARRGRQRRPPITVDGALTAYKTDLIARQGQSLQRRASARASHQHLLSKPVALLDGHRAEELARRPARHDATGHHQPALPLPVCRAGAGRQHDHRRIRNREAWEIGLANLPNAQVARNVILPDDKVHEFVARAYALDDQFGLLTETLAITGARPSQAVRLRVEDLHDHPLRPKLMMPKSAKGGGRNRSAEKDWNATACRSQQRCRSD